ncbi:MAG: hypothetical protein U0V75_02410 [Ferruginibacter sp.]
MKQILFAVLFFVSVTALGQSDKYVAAMQKNMAAMDSGFKNPASFLAIANNFERIAAAEKNQWLPYYYASLCQVNYAFTQMQGNMGAVDGIADKANTLILKADSLQPKNSEISCIKSMIATCHMIVDPMNRWMQYGQEITANNDAAIEQDPSNPRPHYLKGENLKGTPEQFGGGCAAAKPELQKAQELFAAFKPASELHPNWGKQRVEMLLNECK